MKKVNALFIFGMCIAASCAPKIKNDISEEPIITMSPEVNAGQSIYNNQCTKCHKAKPVKNFSEEEWGTILPEMSKLAELNSEDFSNVKAYVEWMLQN